MVFHIKLCYLMQNTVGAGTTLQKINVAKSDFDPPSVSYLFWGVLEIFCSFVILILLKSFVLPDFELNWK
jgi:hypothetical protein